METFAFRRKQNMERNLWVALVCAGRVKHVTDLDLTVNRTGPHDGGACREAGAPGGHEVE